MITLYEANHLTLGFYKGPYIKYDRNYLAFLYPSPLWLQNDVIVTKQRDITISYTDCNSLTPLPPRLRSYLLYGP